ncbi:MAG: sigma-54-dependent transcriptional regulator [Desulfobacteraceae bacterium]
MAGILIIDDDLQIRRLLERLVARLGYKAESAAGIREGLSKAKSGDIDLILLDVVLPDGDGLEALPLFQHTPSSPEVIILTGKGSADGAEKAIRAGAWDYLEKPPTMDTVTLSLTRALQYRSERRKAKAQEFIDTSDIIGSNPGIRACVNQVANSAGSEANVLIYGETGTGKELFAWAIHKNSPRKDKGFVVVDCASLPESLVESTLFGHEKGAFTGADRPRKGLVAEADGGTLFLDEVGELPMGLQKNFLRVLQDGSFRPIGGKGEVRSDFRLISATNRSLDDMVSEGRFRQDLLFRLRGTAVDLPPLRSRGDDIRALAFHFMGRLCERYGMEQKGFSPEYLDLLARYTWPGNVRELSHTIEHSFTEAGDSRIVFPKHLPPYLRVTLARAEVRKPENNEEPSSPVECMIPALEGTFRGFRNKALSIAEKTYLEHLMGRTGENIQEACGLSGLSRARLYTLLKKHNILRSH